MFDERLDEAVRFAHEVHRAQVRKGTDIPYITHVLAVASLVGEHGGTQAQVMGALLHDAIEDGVEHMPDVAAQIEARFGAEVLAIVEACTDARVVPKPPWEARKRAYIAHLKEAPDGSPALLVSAADKLHNARAIVRDHGLLGDALWSRFRATPAQTAWYYNEIVAALRAKRWPTPLQGALIDALAEAVARLEVCAASASVR